MLYHIRHIGTPYAAETESFDGNSIISWIGSKECDFCLGLFSTTG